MSLKKKLLPCILPIIVLIVWYLITDGFGLVPSFKLPSPVDVCHSAYTIIMNGRLLDNTISTLIKVFLGIILASIVAIPVGICLGYSKTLDSFCSLLISILRPIPPIAWIPFSILWFGIGLNSAVFIIFMGCVFPLLVYTIDGVKRTPSILIESAQTLGADNGTILRRIILPSSVPYIVSGLKVGVSIALMCTVAAEMIGSSTGLGYMIQTASNLMDPGTTVVGMLVIGLIGILFDYGFTKIQDKIFW
ncbi:MAG: ABC transporter permease [Methanobrevibacter sp.]